MLPRSQAIAMKTRLPSYSLYGEQGRAADIEWLHCESIAERSRLHDWEIRPHRHELLYQILFIRTGKAELTLESQSTSVRGPCVVTVPALAVHGFHFSSDVDGVVVTVLEQHLRRLLESEAGLQDRLLPLAAPQARPQRLRPRSARPLLALRSEYQGTAPWRALAIDAALLRLLLALGRRLPGTNDTPARARRACARTRAALSWLGGNSLSRAARRCRPVPPSWASRPHS